MRKEGNKDHADLDLDSDWFHRVLKGTYKFMEQNNDFEAFRQFETAVVTNPT